jgi:hypothetical protein
MEIGNGCATEIYRRNKAQCANGYVLPETEKRQVITHYQLDMRCVRKRAGFAPKYDIALADEARNGARGRSLQSRLAAV